MQAWRMRFLGIDSVPGWLGDTEIEQFFTLSPAEIATVRARRAETLQLGLALQIGFLRMTGCVMNSTDVIPRRVLEFLGMQLEIKTPRVTSLRALYARKPTLHEHQRLALAQLKFRPLTDRVQRHLIAYLRRTRGAATDPSELLVSARQWLYEARCLIVGERYLLDLCRQVISNDEAQLAKEFNKRVTPTKRKAWVAALMESHSEVTGINRLDWIKRSPRSRRGLALADAFERVQYLHRMGIASIEFPALPIDLIKTYAARVSRLKLTRIARLHPTTRDIGLPCFLLMTLWRTTDEAIDAWLMRVAEIRRLAMDRSATKAEIDWQRRHESLVARVAELAVSAGDDLPTRLAALVAEEQAPRQSRAEHARHTLLGMSAHVRRLLRLLVALPIQCRQPDDWLSQALVQLQQTYATQQDRLNASVGLTFLPPLWRRITPRNDGERLRLLEMRSCLAATAAQFAHGASLCSEQPLLPLTGCATDPPRTLGRATKHLLEAVGHCRHARRYH